jgi:hypothetical protein
LSQPNPTPELESLAALLRLVTAKGLADSAGLLARKEAWAEAYRRTPHGKPVELTAESNGGF